MSGFFRRFSDIVGFIANLGGALAFIGLIIGTSIVFMNPQDLAKAVANFEVLLVEARKDVGRVAVATEATAKNTKDIATSAQKMANAVPFWIRIDDYAGEKILSSKSREMNIRNPSNYPVALKIKIFETNTVVFNDNVTIMPLEGKNIRWNTKNLYGSPDFTLCLSGTSDAFEGTIYERRLYKDEKMHPVRQFQKIDGC